MKKKILFMGMLVMILFLGNVNVVKALRGSYVGGTVIVRWIDYGDVDNTRPESFEMYVTDQTYNVDNHEVITINKPSDENIRVSADDPNITEWVIKSSGNSSDNFFIQRTSPSVEPEYVYSYTSDMPGYMYLPNANEGAITLEKRDFNAHIIKEAGTLTITFVKTTYKPMKLTVNYNDDQARDYSGSRYLWFALRGKNIPEDELVSENAYHEYKVFPEYTIGRKKDIYTNEDVFVSNYYTNVNPPYAIEYELVDLENGSYGNRELSFEVNDTNAIVNVTYHADTIEVPIKVTWDDNDNIKGVRPESMVLKAYDQNGNFEKDINISTDDNWNVNATLFKNMIYSNGTPINYVMKIDNDDNYEYTVTGDNNGFEVMAKLLDNGDAQEINHNTSIDNNVNSPKTFDGVVSYIILGVVSLVLLVGIIIAIKKLKNNK